MVALLIERAQKILRHRIARAAPPTCSRATRRWRLPRCPARADTPTPAVLGRADCPHRPKPWSCAIVSWPPAGAPRRRFPARWRLPAHSCPAERPTPTKTTTSAAAAIASQRVRGAVRGLGFFRFRNRGARLFAGVLQHDGLIFSLLVRPGRPARSLLPRADGSAGVGACSTSTSAPPPPAARQCRLLDAMRLRAPMRAARRRFRHGVPGRPPPARGTAGTDAGRRRAASSRSSNSAMARACSRAVISALASSAFKARSKTLRRRSSHASGVETDGSDVCSALETGCGGAGGRSSRCCAIRALRSLHQRRHQGGLAAEMGVKDVAIHTGLGAKRRNGKSIVSPQHHAPWRHPAAGRARSRRRLQVSIAPWRIRSPPASNYREAITIRVPDPDAI